MRVGHQTGKTWALSWYAYPVFSPARYSAHRLNFPYIILGKSRASETKLLVAVCNYIVK